jgi:uncharacterized protein YecT (DUF1311 family)
VRRPALLALLALLGWLPPAAADDAFDACMKSKGAGDTQCGEDWVKREQARVDETWRELSQMVDGDLAKSLTDEQRAWEVFRDASCTFKLDPGFGGTGGPKGFHACRAGVIGARASALDAYISYIDN